MSYNHLLGSNRLLRACAIVLAVAAPTTVFADDDALERAQLVALLRHLDLAESLAQHAESVAPERAQRFHFDHARLREDIQRIRDGLEAYLVPQRAQPRDPIPLMGDYFRREDRPEAQP